ncbi:MAG: two-component sensor histidine kinase, partial [Alphaproteobacteria bacterium]|nr:two-component sensor histidine kinase [Alphaproteobacteria bacterium]
MTARDLPMAAIFLAAYVGLDWLSFFHAWGALGITPWNPSPALGLVLLMRRGLGWAPLLFVAQLGAELLVRGLPAPWPATLGAALAVAAVYAGAAAVLRARPIGPRVPDLLRLFVVAAGAAALAGLAYVAVFTLAGLLPAGEFGQAALRYWIGDGSGSVGVVPLALAVPGRAERPAAWGEA